MTHNIPALLGIAALSFALPVVASAATVPSPMFSAETIAAGPIIPAGDDNTMDITNAERAYLAQVCPSVNAHPGKYSAVLVRFCQETRS